MKTHYSTPSVVFTTQSLRFGRCFFPKRLFAMLMLLAGTSLTALASLTPGCEYYIWLNIYEKLLGSNETGTAPALSAYATNSSADSYVFVAEESGTSGYVLLRQKNSGRYLAASSANNYSVLFETSRSTDSRFLWSADEGCYSYIINKKNNKYLGIDGANKGSTYVSVYYDKPKGSHSQYTIIPATAGTWADARQVYESALYTNPQGVSEVDYCQIKDRTIDRSDAVDLHITSNDNPILGSTTINLGSDRTWLIFDNIQPSEVMSKYLKYVRINGVAAKSGTNCRVAIYLNGAAVIPLPPSAMTCTATNGDFALAPGNHKNLQAYSNTMTAFILRRGHMATLASGTNGSGYSQVYVADHADLQVTLPRALWGRVSSVNVRQWQYLSKKGWGNTGGTSGGPQLRATWYWSWSAAYNSTADMEYVPCRQHRYWPSAADVNSHTASAAMSLNEPEHAEQHTSSQCSCGGTIDEWTAYTLNADFLPSGGRIGSPQPTDDGYLTNFCQHVDNMQSRCDFVVTHAYWDLSTYDEAGYANWFCNTKCKNIWNNTGRPLWLSEMEISASWNGTRITSYEQNRKYLQVLLQKIEECPWIERYAIYGTDMWQTYMFYEANPSKGLTPAGQVYRDHRATFAYNAKYVKTPNWWAPSTKRPTLQYNISASKNTITFTMGNTNGDYTKTLILQQQSIDGTWTDIYAVTDRSLFDGSTLSYSLSLDSIDLEGATFRLFTTTTLDTEAVSEPIHTGYVVNPSIVTTSKTAVPGWTCERNSQNGYTKADSGDTYLEVWGPTARDIDFDYYQQLTDIPNGVYALSAVCFNSTNGEAGATVNGRVGLYALADGVCYFAPVTHDSEIDYSRSTTIDTIVVRNGSLRIGIRNVGAMTARWAGADNFSLRYIGTEGEVLTGDYADFVRRAQQPLLRLLPALNDSTLDATGLMANADCSRATTDRWSTLNLATNKGESWDGDASNTYWDKWNSGSLTSSMKQTVEYLPAGVYTLSALARCSAAQTVYLRATLTATDGSTQTREVNLKGTGNQATTDSAYPNGWQQLTTPSFAVEPGSLLTIEAGIQTTATAWWSIDRFRLDYQPDKVEPVSPLVGDIDGDGQISVSDITLLIAIYLGTEQPEAYASSIDIDCDSHFTVNDISQLIAVYLGSN